MKPIADPAVANLMLTQAIVALSHAASALEGIAEVALASDDGNPIGQIALSAAHRARATIAATLEEP